MHIEEKRKVYYPYSRRQFIKGLGVIGMWSMLPYLSGCRSDFSPVKEGILGTHSQMAADVMDILFPEDGHGPGSVQINAYSYLNWVLADENYDADIKKSIFKGFARLADFSKEHLGKPFGKMSPKEKEHLIAKVTQYGWGESLMARLVSLILDALVIDPIYGVNVKEVGWKWLEHIPGHPRATAANKYPDILGRKKELVIFSNPSQL
ncbi:MAG TPA: hypothetical protein ENK85_06205 [Saprospiraceae bacterium]|nr:hypothetical protein [Saprospiraceae bacterium]